MHVVLVMSVTNQFIIMIFHLLYVNVTIKRAYLNYLNNQINEEELVFFYLFSMTRPRTRESDIIEDNN